MKKLSMDIKLGIGALVLMTGTAIAHDAFFNKGDPNDVRFTVNVGPDQSQELQAVFIAKAAGESKPLIRYACRDMEELEQPALSTAFAAASVLPENVEKIMGKFQAELPVLWRVARIRCHTEAQASGGPRLYI